MPSVRAQRRARRGPRRDRGRRERRCTPTGSADPHRPHLRSRRGPRRGDGDLRPPWSPWPRAERGGPEVDCAVGGLLALCEYERILWRGDPRPPSAASARRVTRAPRSPRRARSTEAGLRRIEVLAEHGRLSESVAAGARAMVARLDRMRSAAAVEEAEAVRELVVASGLAPHDAAFDAVQPDLLERLGPAPGPFLLVPSATRRPWRFPTPWRRLGFVPSRPRHGQGSTWGYTSVHRRAPSIRCAGAASSACGCPGRGVGGRAAAAAQQREAARESYEDEALALEARGRDARARRPPRCALGRDDRPAGGGDSRPVGRERARPSSSPRSRRWWRGCTRSRDARTWSQRGSRTLRQQPSPCSNSRRRGTNRRLRWTVTGVLGTRGGIR